MFNRTRNKTATELEQQTIEAVISSDTKITGNITGHSSIRIDGSVEGDVSMKSGIIMGEKSMVHGNLQSDYIVIYGKLTGNIQAKGLYVKSSGVISGDINVDVIEIEVGGKYSGVLKMQGVTEKQL